MFYKNIEKTNAPWKAEVFKNIFNVDYDHTTIFGAQNRVDTRYLTNASGEAGIQTDLLDLRQTELDKWDELPLVEPKILDASDLFALDDYLKDLIEKGIKNPFLFENLSGHPNRLIYQHLILNYFPVSIFYAHHRGGTIKKAEEQFNVKKFLLGNKMNYLLILTKKIDYPVNQIKLDYSLDIVKRKIKAKEVRRKTYLKKKSGIAMRKWTKRK